MKITPYARGFMAGLVTAAVFALGACRPSLSHVFAVLPNHRKFYDAALPVRYEAMVPYDKAHALWLSKDHTFQIANGADTVSRGFWDLHGDSVCVTTMLPAAADSVPGTAIAHQRCSEVTAGELFDRNKIFDGKTTLWWESPANLLWPPSKTDTVPVGPLP